MAKKPATLVIRQVRSASGHPERLRRTLRALGLRGHQKSVEQKDSPAIRGMIEKVRHLVQVEER
ncbi:MAG TPA: 50S ribosomal protein L30 [Gemmatimonadota bacterium]|nr:50S ribosomal protein L30 [Gemmatimonadota bacterium]